MSSCFASVRPTNQVSPEILQAQCQYFANASTLTTLVNAITEMVLVLNAQYQIVYANRAVFEFFGRSPTDSLCGLSPGELFGCIHAVAPAAGCGTVPACQVCGSAQAIAQGLGGQTAVRECRIVQAAT